MAASRRTEEELAELAVLLAARDAAMAAKDWTRGVDADIEFHLAVVRCAHNTLLSELYQGLTEVIGASVASTVEPTGETPISHAGLLEAIRDRDPMRAVAEARGFLDELIANLA